MNNSDSLKNDMIANYNLDKKAKKELEELLDRETLILRDFLERMIMSLTIKKVLNQSSLN